MQITLGDRTQYDLNAAWKRIRKYQNMKTTKEEMFIESSIC